ncbi:P-loop containing nucleoside triphosphate hydrolase protein [Mycena galericulata]|nr:P-loop containing nucleoside triphosphate hydrolase protein [Mycena galericulata]
MAAANLKGLCEDLERCLQDILDAVKPLQKRPKGLSGRFKEVMKLSSTTEQITGLQTRIQTLRSNFLLAAMIDTNHQVNRLTVATNIPVPPPVQSINNCPPPSRIFQGRQAILDKMHGYFDQDTGDQHIFLLHGLGGAGKTQIALKFIKQALTQFSDIFLIDTSTQDTIDRSLKNIAVTKNAGTSGQDALRWLSSTPSQWLLFFDNADDPKIDLNQYFPKCSHGNILITSRNPGLCVYAGAHSLVSDMEESDAIVLLLTSAVQDITLKNKEISAKIVKALWYLPLAIIQAGAFIAKSGALNTYLALYNENRACLLSEKPTQSHDDYAWTVYTTWQISFNQLSQPAATLLQLCSFLHHQGIYEGIFSGASLYELEDYGPSQEELQKPLEILSQFLRPDGTWDSLSFVVSTNELRAYSLINLNMETGLFSIHPLVHSWSRSTLVNPDTWHLAAVSIVGMSIATTPDKDKQLMSLKMLTHIDSLRFGQQQVVPDFNLQYGAVYYYSGKIETAAGFSAEMVENRKIRFGDSHVATLDAMTGLASTYSLMGQLEEAEKLGVLVVENQKKILGEDHPDTLLTMSNLADTYRQMGRLEEAEQFGVLVVEKKKKIFGEDHPNTLTTIGNLASTYKQTGRLEEAEKLEVLVVKKQKKILGKDHPDTLLTMSNLASTYHRMGRLEEAEKLGVLVVEKRKKILGEDHPNTLLIMSNLASTYNQMGRFEEAAELEVLVVEKQRKILGEDHPDTLRALGNLALRYLDIGKLEEAEKLGVLVVQKRTRLLGEDNPATLRSMSRLEDTYRALGNVEEAESLKLLVENIKTSKK